MKKYVFIFLIITAFLVSFKGVDEAVQAEVPHSKHLISFPSPRQFAKLIADDIFKMISDEKQEGIDITAFVKGMEDCEANIVSPLENRAYMELSSNMFEAEAKWKARRNLKEADRFFSKLSTQMDRVCLIPNKLYYKIIKEGKGKSIENESAEVAANYHLTKLDGSLFEELGSSEGIITIQISDLVSGLSRAMVGMKIDEVREIYVHPQYTIDNATAASQNIGLIAHMEISKINNQKSDGYIVVESITEYPIESEETLFKNYEAAREKLSYFLGVKTWNHLRYGKEWYSFADIMQSLAEAKKNSNETATDPEKEAIFSRLHFMLYQKQQ